MRSKCSFAVWVVCLVAFILLSSADASDREKRRKNEDEGKLEPTESYEYEEGYEYEDNGVYNEQERMKGTDLVDSDYYFGEYEEVVFSPEERTEEGPRRDDGMGKGSGFDFVDSRKSGPYVDESTYDYYVDDDDAFYDDASLLDVGSDRYEEGGEVPGREGSREDSILRRQRTEASDPQRLKDSVGKDRSEGETRSDPNANKQGDDGHVGTTKRSAHASAPEKHMRKRRPMDVGKEKEAKYDDIFLGSWTTGGAQEGSEPVINMHLRLRKEMYTEPLVREELIVLVDDKEESRVKVEAGGLLQVTIDASTVDGPEDSSDSFIQLIYRGDPIAWFYLDGTKTERWPVFSESVDDDEVGLDRDETLEEEVEWEMLRADEGDVEGESELSPEETRLEGIYREGRKLLWDEEIVAALKKLEEASREGHDGAVGTLGALYISGYGTKLSRDEKRGVKLLREAANMGNPDAYALLGLLYASGWSEEVELNTAKAVLYWTIGARGGSIYAQMALGYRHLYGIDVEKNCDRASFFYLQAADQVIAEVNTHEVFMPMSEDVRLDDVPDMRRRSQQIEVVQFYKHSAERGDVNQQLALGRLHLFGAPGLRQDFERARELFTRAAEAHDPRAHAFLGFMYYRGVGVEKNNATAWNHFQMSSTADDAAGLHGVGVAYRFGAGVEQDYGKALEYFQKAAKKHHAEALYSLGTMYLEGLGVEQSKKTALTKFMEAAKQQNLHAMYQVGAMTRNRKHGLPKDCTSASKHLKLVTEMWTGGQITSYAFDLFESGDYSSALLRYLQAAHLGLEVAQFNAAYMIERRLGTDGRFKGNEDLVALELYKRSALQGFVNSDIRVGDILYDKVKDYEGAAAAYQKAKDQSSEALFNLGMMHVIGRGLPVDLHLAKRYFDQSKAGSPEAFLPAVIALQLLKFYSQWNPFIDRAVEWVSVLAHNVFGTDVHLPAETRTVSSTTDSEEEMENNFAFTLTEYLDLIMLMALLGALFLVIITRQRRLRRANPPPTH